MMMDRDLARRFQQSRDERAYWERHYPAFLAQYPDEWIAVYEDTIVAHAPHVWDLINALEDRGIDAREAWITFLNATRRAVSL
jgi:hypothetical protein